eukprot:gb/GECG01010375.1/.p1 GENE.gb/GECG01010375.1/~~gb/GECG01010375.1/.p1  ORF type:complete len:637 (+),score=62.98 gb/GECG01010375.1/:1-1911(+)
MSDGGSTYYSSSTRGSRYRPKMVGNGQYTRGVYPPHHGAGGGNRGAPVYHRHQHYQEERKRKSPSRKGKNNYGGERSSRSSSKSSKRRTKKRRRRHGSEASSSSSHKHKKGDQDGSSSSGGGGGDDSEGHYKGKAGDIIRNRYKVVSESGVGTFGRVLHCYDLESDTHVAIKVIRKIQKYIDSAKVEADILRDVNAKDPDGRSLCIRFYGEFEWRGHLCMVFEALGLSVYEYIKKNDFHPLPLYCVQAFADQTTTAVAFLHAMKLIHTDLKPENILLVSREPLRRTRRATCDENKASVLAPASTAAKLIDFGGATYVKEKEKTSLINTRQYRAPEVTLGVGWSTPSDIWSLGCILMEMYTGNLLFQTRDSLEHLALMEKVLGPFPKSLALADTKASRKYFDSRGNVRFPTSSTRQSSVKFVQKQRRLEEIISPRDEVFLDLIRRMLEFDPKKRITAAEALNHKFFTKVRDYKTPPVPESLIASNRGNGRRDNSGPSYSKFSNHRPSASPRESVRSSRERSKKRSPSRSKTQSRSRSESSGKSDRSRFEHKQKERSWSHSPPRNHTTDNGGEPPRSAIYARNAATAASRMARNHGWLDEKSSKSRGRYSSPQVRYGSPRTRYQEGPGCSRSRTAVMS